MPDDDGIRWPREFAEAPVHVSNEMVMNVPCENVWAWLVRADLWPEWYPNSANVEFLTSFGPKLSLGHVFRWKTFGVHVISQVKECDFRERLAWNARGFGVRAYHAWLIQEEKGGCRVLTEERQHGFLCRLNSLVFPNRMHKGHQLWLERLQEKARGGPPA
jgi:uncharacterized protein YndB with AHSA1/START domain